MSALGKGSLASAGFQLEANATAWLHRRFSLSIALAVSFFLCLSRSRDQISSADDNSVVTGLVLDSQLRPVSGALVFLNLWWRPMVAVPSANISERPWQTESGLDGRFSFPASSSIRSIIDSDQVRIWASRGARQSLSRVLRPSNGRLVVPPLVLEIATRVRVLVHQDNGQCSDGMAIEVSMSEQGQKIHDERGAYFHAIGRTASGEFVVEQAPPGKFGEFHVEVLDLGGVRSSFDGEECHPTIRGQAVDLEVSISRRSSIVGRLVESSGRPASGMLVAVRDPRLGDPKVAEYVATDSEGRFIVQCATRNTLWLVACVRARANGAQGIVAPPRPILSIQLPSSRADGVNMGELCLPIRRTIQFIVTDEEGEPSNGTLSLQREEFVHGSLVYRLDSMGGVEVTDVPVDDGQWVDVVVRDQRYGDIGARRRIRMSDSPIMKIRVTGAGNIIATFRDRQGGAKLSVWDPLLVWRSRRGEYSQRANGRVSDVRLLRDIDEIGDAEMQVAGYSPVLISSVRLKVDRPTYIECVLDALPSR